MNHPPWHRLNRSRDHYNLVATLVEVTGEQRPNLPSTASQNYVTRTGHGVTSKTVGSSP
jgi:hypothetical protein